jgi:SAM-dependent methyltransferase
MSARVKLLTVWDGPLPSWWSQFVERIAALKVVSHQLVPMGVADLNHVAAERFGTPCRKLTAHAQCDLRPTFGELFDYAYAGYEFWGWCDLDVVLGDLDRLLPPLLDAHDVVTADAGGVAGPFTVLRNTPELVELFRRDERWTEVFADPDYCNFDETGFAESGYWGANPSLTGLLRRDSDFKVRYDDRTWTETADPLPQYGVPSRGCELVGRKLRELPTGRELLLYHFTRTPKRWPLPDRYPRYRRRQWEYWRGLAEPVPNPAAAPAPPALPVTSAAYWDARVEGVLAAGLPVYRTVYDGPEDRWEAIQKSSAVALRDNVPAGSNVLDVGGGYGALTYGQFYGWTGVDVSPRMIELARERCDPALSFFAVDARALPFAADEFDWCVCRGLEGSVRVREGNAEWRRFRGEMLRVAPRALLLDYSGGAKVLRREDYSC